MISPESLFDRIVYSDVQRRMARGEARTPLSPWQRTIQEPFFNLIGTVIGLLWKSAPFSWRRHMDPWLCQKMGGHAALPTSQLHERIQETLALACELHESTGRWPGLLFLTSHPPTEGPHAWVRFEVLRQGLEIAFAVSAEGRRRGVKAKNPECLLAVDPYALDSVSVPIGAIYAAFIYQVYFAYDRQASTQSWLQRLLFLRGAGYATAGFRLLERVRDLVPVLMAFGGGLPVNARLYYAAREFVQRLPLSGVRKRQAEYDWIRELEMKGQEDPAVSGVISPATAQALQALLGQWGFSPPQVQAYWAEFVHEFKRLVPLRERLWKILMRRVIQRGQGLIVIAAQHHENPASVQIAPPKAFSPHDLLDSHRLAEQFGQFYK